jgi:hypothetical protein
MDGGEGSGRDVSRRKHVRRAYGERPVAILDDPIARTGFNLPLKRGNIKVEFPAPLSAAPSCKRAQKRFVGVERFPRRHLSGFNLNGLFVVLGHIVLRG